MVSILRGEYDPYDLTVYDKRHRRKTLMASIRRAGVNHRKAVLAHAEEIRKRDEQ